MTRSHMTTDGQAGWRRGEGSSSLSMETLHANGKPCHAPTLPHGNGESKNTLGAALCRSRAFGKRGNDGGF